MRDKCGIHLFIYARFSLALEISSFDLIQHITSTQGLNLKLSVVSSYYDSINFELRATGIAVRVMSDHTVGELQILLNWLSEDSKDDDNLITNQSKVILFAKKMIKAAKY